MRDLDALLTSLVSIDRDSLVAILSSEAETTARLASSMRQRTAQQRAKRRQALERAAWVERMLSFIRDGEASDEMSEADFAICQSLEEMLRAREKSSSGVD